MKLIIFELAGKKEAKKCRTINDIIMLGTRLIDSDKYDDNVKRCILNEAIYLNNEPMVTTLDESLSSITGGRPSVSVPPEFNNFSLRIVEGKKVDTICYVKENNYFTVSMSFEHKKNELGLLFIGSIDIEDDKHGATYLNDDNEKVNEQLLNKLSYYSLLLKMLITGELELKTVEYVPMLKYGRYHIKPSTIIRHRKPCLVASHDRAEHFKVLRSPRYYKDGIVPENEDELRRIPVKGCHVKRDIERVVIK